MNFYSILITILIGVLSLSSQGQDRSDSIRQARSAQFNRNAAQQEKNYYRRQLNGDTVKAARVQKIQQDYKAKMKAVEADQSLNTEAKRSRFQAIIEEKNEKLEKVLSPEQQARMIPASEREKKTKKTN